MGAVGDVDGRLALMGRVLAEAASPHPPGTVVDLGLTWPDDERERQLMLAD